MIMKRIVSIQDISCLGKCSLTVALPVISAMEIETCIIPTAVLSTHTVFKGFTFADLTDQIQPISNHWQKEGFEFDAIYTGYLGSAEQVDIVTKFFDDFKTDNNFVFVDPAMADNGKLYPSFDDDFPSYMAKVCAKADIIVPNLTEACLMTNTEYKTEYDKEYIEDLLKKLIKLGAKKAIMTGVAIDGKYGIMSYDPQANEFDYYTHNKINKVFHGTGDVFASTCVGALVNGKTLAQAVKIAGDFTYESIKATIEDPEGHDYGVNFEAVLPMLMNKE